ncbi:MAG: hypothetical protein QNJ37_09965 [Crocosphaera sp.]|nr:hypothetical protein [Crocosphaera sp.]
MLAIFPLITLLLLFFILYQPKQDWRRSYLSAVIILGSLIALSTELLSLINSINYPIIISFWIITNLVLAGFYYRRVSKKQQLFPLFSFPKITKLSGLILAGIMIIIVLVGIVSPENYSAKLMDKSPYNQFNYCALIAIRSSKDEPIEEMQVNKQLFIENWSSSSVKLLLPKN